MFGFTGASAGIEQLASGPQMDRFADVTLSTAGLAASATTLRWFVTATKTMPRCAFGRDRKFARS
jgi:hypothetical protein